MSDEQPQTDETLARRALIAQLFGAFGKTPSEAQYAGYEAGLKLMATPRLARVVSTWLEGIADATDPQDLRVPTAGRLWEIARKMRKLPPPRVLELKAHEPKFLPFDTNANLLLMAYIGQGFAERVRAHQRQVTRDAGRYVPAARLAILVKWKNGWASDMREDRADGGKRDGKALWAEYMAQAEAEIDQLIAAEKAAA